ncbi:MAG: MSHA biogenesis protein MshL [Pseudomonas sp.]|jgi:MSHA biogenesis protein MshL
MLSKPAFRFRLLHLQLRLALLGALSLLAACQTFKDGDQQLYEQSNKILAETLAQSRAKVAPPLSVQAALIAPLPQTALLRSRPRFDVAAKDMPAKEFFLSLMDGAGQNIVVPPEVTGNITFSLRNVTLEEVLAAVRDSYGYDFSRASYGYQIFPNQAITRTYDINYLNLQRMGFTDTEVSSGQVNTSNDSDSSNGATTNSTTSSTRPASQLITTSNVDFWKEVHSVVSMIVGNQEGNNVVVNPQAGLMVVRASAADQQSVEGFLKLAHSNLQRQVILETKILEVNLFDRFQAGVNWEQFGSNGGAGLAGAALSGIQTVGGVFSATVTAGDFTGTLQLLESQGEVRVLSTPRISTLNNQKAVIKVGTDEYFVTDVSASTTTSSTGDGTSTPDITLTPFFSGISLDVTPQIDAQSNVTLHVRPSVSKVSQDNKQIDLGKSFGTLNLPTARTTSRQSDSIVRARNGQVVVIGGLLQSDNENVDANVPWLSKIPLLGWLFQQQRKNLGKSELVILMRPQVITEDTWLNEIQKSAEAFRELR